jgi:hypothetical protein
LTCGNTELKVCHIHNAYEHKHIIKLPSGPLEVGYTALTSGYEKPLVEALQKLGINLISEPVLYLSIFM